MSGDRRPRRGRDYRGLVIFLVPLLPLIVVVAGLWFFLKTLGALVMWMVQGVRAMMH